MSCPQSSPGKRQFAAECATIVAGSDISRTVSALFKLSDALISMSPRGLRPHTGRSLLSYSFRSFNSQRIKIRAKCSVPDSTAASNRLLGVRSKLACNWIARSLCDESTELSRDSTQGEDLHVVV